MAKEVNLLSYWMPFLRKIKEFKEIAQSEEPELRYILEARDRALDNLFIETADEYGIERFESMMGIVPEATDTLEIRRFRISAKWNDSTPYTEPVLYRRLLSMYGSEDAFEIEEHYTDYWLKITTHSGIFGSYEMLISMLDEMLPCNLVLELENILEDEIFHTLYFGGVCCTAFVYSITQDILSDISIDAPLRVGIGYAQGNTHLLTHDIRTGANILAPHNKAVVGSVGFTSKITHDVELKDVLSGSVVGAMGVSTAHTKLITHDISSKVSDTGNTAVANPVSIATVITIKNS